MISERFSNLLILSKAGARARGRVKVSIRLLEGALTGSVFTREVG